MSPEWSKLLDRLNSETEDRLSQLVPSLIDEIKVLSNEEKAELVATAMQNRVTDIEEIKRGNRARLAFNVVLRAVGTRNIRSPEQEAIWKEVAEDVKGLNGNPEAYRRLNLRPARHIILDGTEAHESESGGG